MSSGPIKGIQTAAKSQGSAAQWAGGDPAQGVKVTSHSLSLHTRLFDLDFSWSSTKVEPGAGLPAGPLSEPSRETAARRATAAPQHPPFREMLRREQLARLLRPVDHPPLPACGEALTQPMLTGSSRLAREDGRPDEPLCLPVPLFDRHTGRHS